MRRSEHDPEPAVRFFSSNIDTKNVELREFEPLTFVMPCMRVSSDGVALSPVTALQSGSGVWGRVAGSGEIWARWSLNWSWFSRLPGQGKSNHGNPSHL